MNIRLNTLFWLACLALPWAVQAGEHPAYRCDRLYLLSEAGNAINPGVVVEASEGVPAHCRVRGVIEGTMRFELRMPIEGWNGRFWFLAPGGLAGAIGDTTSLLDDGFAMSTTDSGHEGESDPTFHRDDFAQMNYGFRSNHLTAQLSRRIIAEFYGREVEYAYLSGCSKGGHGALMEALRYPDDFDGIIAGAPATEQVTDLLVWALENTRQQKQHGLTPESVAVLDANSKRACDLLDGAADGIISNPKKCTLDRLELDKLECRNGQTSGCLTAGQVDYARFIYTGITDETGEVIVPGVYPGAELGGDFELWITGPVPFLPGSANDTTVEVLENILHRDPTFDIDTFDTIKGIDQLIDATSAVTLPKPDFSGLMESGNKLIIYNGWHDHPCRAAELEGFLSEARALNARALDEHVRTFMVPGMVHCRGGPGAWAADYIGAIVDWVEKDIVPDRIIAEHPGDFTFLEAFAIAAGVNWGEEMMKAGEAQKDRKRFSRPLCPYPKYARYNGTGDINDAANFTCIED